MQLEFKGLNTLAAFLLYQIVVAEKVTDLKAEHGILY